MSHSGQGLVEIYCGRGRGKSTAAFGQAVQHASKGKNVIIVQFLKEQKNEFEMDYLQRFEPEIRMFRFEKLPQSYEGLTEADKQDAIQNIRNGMAYAKKVLLTGECQLLVLDEVLGILEEGIITVEQMRDLLLFKDDETSVILTGTERCEDIEDLADQVYTIDIIKDETVD